MDNKKVSHSFWFAVLVKSRHEFTVHEALTGKGIEAFLPAFEKLSRWKDRNKLIRCPLFPGYLFVCIESSRPAILSVLKTKGVVRLLGTMPGEPEPVPEDQIFSLKKALENKTMLDPYPYLKEGQRVKIIRGPMEGVQGILVQKAGQYRLVLSVDILQQSTALTLNVSDVEKI